MDFKGKVAIVTGGADGIGKAISSLFLKNEMKVCICDVNEPAAKSFLQEVSDESKPNVIFVKCDVSSAEEFRAAFEKTKKTFGKIDVLVNNAGIMNEHDCNRTIEVNFTEIKFAKKSVVNTHHVKSLVLSYKPEEQLDGIAKAKLDVIRLFHSAEKLYNFRRTYLSLESSDIPTGGKNGPIHGIKLAFEFMGTDSGGAGGFIINTASMAGVYPFAHAPVYCGTKHGVVGLTKSYGQSYYFEKTGITVNAVCPGPIDTSLYRRFPTLTIDEAGAKELISTLTPISPNEVAKAVVQLLQDGKNGSLLRVENDEIKYIE